jgi:hypothetical protein
MRKDDQAHCQTLTRSLYQSAPKINQQSTIPTPEPTQKAKRKTPIPKLRPLEDLNRDTILTLGSPDDD